MNESCAATHARPDILSAAAVLLACSNAGAGQYDAGQDLVHFDPSRGEPSEGRANGCGIKPL